jgi:glucosamine--fructose-6-phosphate aminotransferase (isomerizing)
MPKVDSSKVPPRAEHPYHMHDAMMAQPAALEAVLDAPGDAFERAAEALTEADRVYLTGMGTSLHAATVGRYLLEHALGTEADLRVASAFELSVRGKFSKADAVIVVSHRGWKRYAARVVELAKAGQAATIAVTGKGGGEEVRVASVVLETCEQERSAAHTISYTTAIAALARTAVEAGRAAGRTAPAEALAKDLGAAPKGVAGILKKEGRFVAIAEDLAATESVVLLGTGPDVATAREGALKIVETSYIAVHPYELEQILHGPLAGLKGSELVIHLANGATPAKRTAEAATAIDAIGCRQLGVVQEGSPVDPDLFHWAFRPPKTVEALAPLVNVVPLQLLSYYLAVQKGLDPDEARRADAKFRAAKSRFSL